MNYHFMNLSFYKNHYYTRENIFSRVHLIINHFMIHSYDLFFL